MQVLRKVQSYRALIGLEIHVQLDTASKMFTAAANGAGKSMARMAEPNSLVDEQVLGLPGTLPTLNRRAIELAAIVGLALGCKISPRTKWDRKSYFYPDLPKNYQISQYDLPLCHDGMLEVEGASIRIRRAHLEEDAGKLLHEAPGGFAIDHSIIDLNRAGTPLLEIVTEPDFTSAKQVALFAQQLQKLVQHLGASQGQMQMGHLRFEPNINLHITDANGEIHKTAITEIKNLNSFSVLERSTDYEINRQLQEWRESGSLGRKSTRGWDESRGATFLQREKEEANDYRYFPDPDLPPVEQGVEWIESLRAQIGESPEKRRARFVSAYRLSEADAATLASDRRLAEFFEACLIAQTSPKRVATLLITQGLRLANTMQKHVAELPIQPGTWSALARAIDARELSASSAASVVDHMVVHDGDVPAAIAALGLRQVSDTAAIDAAIRELIASNPPALVDLRAGKQQAVGALVGMIMRGRKGLNPQIVQSRLREILAEAP